MTRPMCKGVKGGGLQPESAAALADGKAGAASRIKTLYRIMQSVEGRLGGGEGVEGLYGSITCSGMQRIVTALEAHCRMGAGSCLVDVGAGLGRPLLHAMLAAGLTSSYGVEIDAIKCQKAAAFLAQTRTELARRGALPPWFAAVPEVSCSAIEQVRTLDPATHAYSFWEGVPSSGKQAFGRLVAASPLLQGVAVVQRAIRAQQPADVMTELGFGDLCLVDSFSVSMSGSGRSFRAYVFRRVLPAAAGLAAAAKDTTAMAAPAVHAEDGAAQQLVEAAAMGQLKPHDAKQTVTPFAVRAAAAVAGRSKTAAARAARREARSAARDAEEAGSTGLAAGTQHAGTAGSVQQRTGSEAAAAAGEPPCRQVAAGTAIASAPPDAAPHAQLPHADAGAEAPTALNNSGAEAEPSAAAVVDDGGADDDQAAGEVQSVPVAAKSPAKRTAADSKAGRSKCSRSQEKGSPSCDGSPQQRPEVPPPPRQGTLWGHVRSHPRSGGRSVKAQLFSGAPPGLRIEGAADAQEVS